MKDPETRTVFAGVDGRAEAQLPDWYAEKRDVAGPVSLAEAIRDLPRASEAQLDAEEGSQASLAGERAFASIKRLEEDVRSKAEQFEDSEDGLRERVQLRWTRPVHDDSHLLLSMPDDDVKGPRCPVCSGPTTSVTVIGPDGAIIVPCGRLVHPDFFNAH